MGISPVSRLSFLSVGCRFLLAAALFFTLGTTLLASFKRSEWQYSKELKGLTAISNGYARFSLDEEVYNRSLISLSDLRLIDDQQREVPFAIIEERNVTTVEQYSPRIFNRAVLPGAYSTLTLELEKPVYHNAVVLKTTSKNFKRRVEVAGSRNGDEWLVLRNNAYIFDFSGDQKVQLTRISYPESNFRFLQIKVWNQEESPLELEGASVFFEKTITPQRRLRSARLISREEDSKLKATVCLLDLGYANIPCDYLAIETPEHNFSRLVEIQGSNEIKEWQRHLQSEFYRFRTTKFDVEKKSFQFPEARNRYLKVIIYNYDDPALRLDKFEVQGIEKDLIFLLESQRQYFLYYGNPQTASPRYDIDKVKQHLKTESLPRLQLEKESPNPNYAPIFPRKPWTEKYPILFWGILVLLVLSLGTYILKLISRVKTT